MLEYLKELCALDGVSGWEDAVREYITEKVKPHAEEISTDALGNLIVFKKGRNRREDKLMVCAHMDEVGGIVCDITDKGYLKFAPVGGIDTRVLIGKRVRVNGKVGVIGIKAVHMTTKDERKKVPDVDELYIDIGATDKTRASELVSLGDRVVFENEFVRIGKNISAKAIDDRAGCAAMIKIIETEIEYDTYFAFTTQEEVGLRGAGACAYAIEPASALILEATTAADLPDFDGAESVCKLNSGAVIGLVDRRCIYDRTRTQKLISLAKGKGIPYQFKTKVAGGNDAGAVHTSLGGIPCVSISAPVRYIHSPVCVASERDLEAMLNLAKAYINA